MQQLKLMEMGIIMNRVNKFVSYSRKTSLNYKIFFAINSEYIILTLDSRQYNKSGLSVFISTVQDIIAVKFSMRLNLWNMSSGLLVTAAVIFSYSLLS